MTNFTKQSLSKVKEITLFPKEKRLILKYSKKEEEVNSNGWMQVMPILIEMEKEGKLTAKVVTK